jgi:cell growth-regulating nucleolar protein
MVSFNCAACNDVVKKPKIPSHMTQCGGRHFSCVDCMQSFDQYTIKAHNSCVSEVTRYQVKSGQPLWQEKLKQKQLALRAAGESTDEPGKRKKSFVPTDLSDTDFSDDGAKAKTAAKTKAVITRSKAPKPHGIETSSDDDDDAAGAKKPAAKKSPKAAPQKRSRPPKPHGIETSSDDEEVAVPKKAAKPASASPAAAPKAAKLSPKMKAATPKVKAASPKQSPKQSPKLAPKLVGDVKVAAFTLGPLEEVLDLVADAVAEQGGEASTKAVAQGLVARVYTKRIAKAVAEAIAAAAAQPNRHVTVSGSKLFTDPPTGTALNKL